LDEGGGMPHVGGGLHLCDRDGHARKIGIANLVAAQQFGKRVAQHFAHAQLAL
jgi:hypothetical protein